MSVLNWILKGLVANDKTGTPARVAADIINGNFEILNNEIIQLQNPDGVLKKGDIDTDGLDVDVAADAFEWQINQQKFLDNPAYSTVLNAATAGYRRKDLLLGNNTGGYNIFEGEEDPTSATEPNLIPAGTIKLGLIDVYGDSITGVVPVDVDGKEDKANKNQPNGYAGLDAGGKIDRNQIPVLDNQIEVDENMNVQNDWNGQTILFTANCTITVPASMINSIMFAFRTLAGVTVSWAITTPFVWETTPVATPEKTTGHFMRRGNTNTIFLD